MRQINAILHTNRDKDKNHQKCPRFKFKPRHVNDSSQSNQGIDYLISLHYLWRGRDINGRKPPLATWKMVTKPKLKGLGIINLRLQNEVFL
jgi:hypothetical protein